MSHDHLPSSAPSQESTDDFVYARRLDHNSDHAAPIFEATEVDLLTLPLLDESQIEMMHKNPWASKDELEQLGLPVGNGVAAFRVGDEVQYYNINPHDDYGTHVRSDKIHMLPMEESLEEAEYEPTPEQVKEIGEEALEAVGMEAPTSFEPSTLPTFEAAKKYITAIAPDGADSTLAKTLHELGDTPESIVEGLHVHPESRDKVRSALTTRLYMLLDEMPSQIKDDREKNVTDVKLYGKEKMPSREYVVEIALAYLDGSFKDANQERSGLGKGGIGEHRTAAQKVLESFAKDAPHTESTEKELFTNDQLQALMLELRGKAEVVTSELANLFSSYGVLTSLRNDLQQNFTDTDVLAQYATRLQVVVDQSMHTLMNEVAAIGRLQGNAAFHDNPQDVERAAQIRESLQMGINTLHETLTSWSMAHLQALNYNADQQLVLQLRAASNNGTLQEQVVDPIEKTRRTIDELVQSL